MVADLMLDNHRKMDSLLKLSDCCKALHKYDIALKILRKALQYAWYLSLPDFELLIYDRMGLLHYLSGDIIKAKYYHERFTLKHLEAYKSPCRLSSQEILRKTFIMNDEENYTIYSASPTQVFPMILAKLSISLEKTEDNTMVFSRKSILQTGVMQKNIRFFYNVNKKDEKNGKSVKFLTDLSAEQLISQLLEEKEFLLEVASPRYPQGNSDSFEVLEDKLPAVSQGLEQKGSKTKENIYIKQQIGHNFSQKKGGISRIADFMQKKISLDEKIRLRNKETVNNDELWKNIRIKSRDMNVEEVRQKSSSCYYNHMSPNRDFQGFEYLFRPRLFNKNLKKYYQNIVFDNI